MPQGFTALPTTGTLSGLTAVQDINTNEAALNSWHSGTSAPASPVANQMWIDTTNGLIKQYNNAAGAWVIKGTMDAPMWGALAAQTVAKSANYSVVDADNGTVFSTTGSWSLSLPNATTLKLGNGFKFAVDNGAGTGTITISSTTSLIDGAALLYLVAGEKIIVYTDGINYFTLSRYTPRGVILRAGNGGTADALTGTFVPPLTLTDQIVCAVQSTGANTTTTPTFSPNGLTAHPITKQGGGALLAGDIGPAGFVALLEYNAANTRWELLNPSFGRALTVADLPAGRSTVVTTTYNVGTASGTMAITGAGFAPRTIILFAARGDANDSGASWGVSKGVNSNLCVYSDMAVAANTFQSATNVVCKIVAASTGDNQTATIASFDADGVTLSWTKTGSPGGIYNLLFVLFQ